MKKMGSDIHCTWILEGNWVLTYTVHSYWREIGDLYVLYTDSGEELGSDIYCI